MPQTLVVDIAGWPRTGTPPASAQMARLGVVSQTGIAYIRSWRQAGGKTVLFSDGRDAGPSDIPPDLFDEVLDLADHPLPCGESKRALLEQRYGPDRFAYMGGGPSDRAVWEAAALVVTVNAPPDLRRLTDAACKRVEHLTEGRASVIDHIRALRPHQWLKNMLAFLPLLAGHRFDAPAILLSTLAFVAFCLAASSVYILNDLSDLEADRAHPRKRHRVFASGAVPVRHGRWMAAGLLALGAVTAASAGQGLLLVVAGYVLLSVAYSAHLKRQVILDICTLAALYTARIVGGAVASDIRLSVWMLAFSGFFFLSLAAVKRQAELTDVAARGKLEAQGRGYQVGDLPIVSMVALGAGYVSVLVLAQYISSPDVTALYARPEMLWGICPVLIYWITRAVMVAHRGQMHDDPLVYSARDPVSILCLILCLGFAAAGALS